MEKSFFKIFFSKTKEKQWLDSLGEKGYLLVKIKDSKYYFECSEEHSYSYSIENLGVSHESDVGIEYISKYSENGVDFLFEKGTWSYFVSVDNAISVTADVYKKNSDVYLWRMIYLGFFAVVFAVVLGYQLFATDFLVNIGHESDGAVAYVVEENVFDKIENAVLKVLNNSYFVPFRVIFGSNDASVVIALVLPAVVILGILFAFNVDEYIVNRNLFKSLASEKGDTDAQQAI